MWPIVTDRVAWFVCRPVTLVSPAKTAEQTEMHAVGVEDSGGPKEAFVTSGSISPMGRSNFGGWEGAAHCEV